MKKTAFFVLICFSFTVMMAYAQNRGIKRIRKISDLSHQSNKLGAYHALVIGIDDYQDTKIPDLSSARKDAEAVAALLRKRYGFQTETLLDRQASKKAIFNALRSLATSTEENDSVLIYFAGHGDIDKIYNDGWWIPADAKGGEPLTYLDNTQVQKAMRSMNARHVLLISDSCYSGTLFGQLRAMPRVIDEKYYLNLYNEKSRWGMTSGNREPVLDSGTGGHSIFAYQFLKALRKNEKPFATTQEIYTRIAPIVGNNAEHTPLCRPIRNTGDQGGEFVFILADSSGAVVVTPEPELEKRLYSTLTVRPNVGGATVYLDRKKMGKGAMTISKIKPGIHRVKVTKEGYKPYETEISLKSGEAAELTAYLDSISESVAELLKSEPIIMATAITKIKEYLKITSEPVTEPFITTDFSNDLGMKFVYIKPGKFMRGGHKVTLTKGFYMQTTEVTQGQWKAVMGSNPSYFKKCGDNCPVENVSWNDAQNLIKKLNQKEGRTYRMPTEAEWEYAARSGGKAEEYSGFSDDALLYQYVNFCDKNCEYSRKDKEQDDGYQYTAPVGSYKPNGLGIYDMSGNVWEWCQDWYGEYPSSDVTDPMGLSEGSIRVLRGGSWSKVAWNCRVAYRGIDNPANHYGSYGIRLVLLPGQQEGR
ncbi:MAG: SUMF1/EgtB/PvdO family nonheme iron enzyme [Desulfobacteraceae bacterium]|nr:SUMF1/EgtB/PvdO family nonheme iron enzyme [Desulfobacteraceae bacterium]